MRERAPDPHAARREEQACKRRHGMRVSGRSTRLLARMAAEIARTAAQAHSTRPAAPTCT
jgi:hypothetical protein